MKPALCLLAALFVFSLVAYSQENPSPVSAHLFGYDAKQPLDVKETARLDRPDCTIIDLTYASPKGGRVPAYLVVPKSKGPFAAILFGHWGGGNRTEFLPEAELYAAAGIISLLPAYPWTRPEPWYRGVFNLASPEQDLAAYTQAVIDLRRGMDLLLARPDVDPKRLAYVGHSYGAQWGAILAAVDKRMKAAVLVGGTPTLTDVVMSDEPSTVAYRKTLPPGQLEKFLDVLRPLDAMNYVGRAAPIPLLFQFARFEQNFSQAAMDRYFNAASEPKTELWYDTAHDLNAIQVLADRAAWLEKPLGTKPLVPLIKRALRKP